MNTRFVRGICLFPPASTFKRATTFLVFAALLTSVPVRGVDVYNPPLNGLVGWWRGEGNGIDSANGHNGTVESGATFASGIYGKAFNFTQTGANNGTSRVYIPDDNAFKLTGSLTISAWVRGDVHSWCILQRGDYRAGLDPYTFG